MCLSAACCTAVKELSGDSCRHYYHYCYHSLSLDSRLLYIIRLSSSLSIAKLQMIKVVVRVARLIEINITSSGKWKHYTETTRDNLGDIHGAIYGPLLVLKPLAVLH